MPENRRAAAELPWRKRRMLEDAIGHDFSDPDLLVLALTHSSRGNEKGRKNNERLEFLGDAVLELCICTELYARYPEASEGELTEALGKLVCEPTLALLAGRICLDQVLLLGKGEEAQGGRNRPSLLADAFEALLAAVYLDGGLEAARAMVAALYADLWPESLAGCRENDPKTRLQEICQARFGELPAYSVIGMEGPDHARLFTVRLRLPDGREFIGRESGVKKAGQVAAASALQEL